MTIKPRASTLSKDYNTMNTVLSPSSSCEQCWFPGQSLHLVPSSSLNPHHKCDPTIQWESLFCRLFWLQLWNLNNNTVSWPFYFLASLPKVYWNYCCRRSLVSDSCNPINLYYTQSLIKFLLMKTSLMTQF